MIVKRIIPVENSPGDFSGILLHEVSIPGLLVDKVVNLAIGPC